MSPKSLWYIYVQDNNKELELKHIFCLTAYSSTYGLYNYWDFTDSICNGNAHLQLSVNKYSQKVTEEWKCKIPRSKRN